MFWWVSFQSFSYRCICTPRYRNKMYKIRILLYTGLSLLCILLLNIVIIFLKINCLKDWRQEPNQQVQGWARNRSRVIMTQTNQLQSCFCRLCAFCIGFLGCWVPLVFIKTSFLLLLLAVSQTKAPPSPILLRTRQHPVFLSGRERTTPH